MSGKKRLDDIDLTNDPIFSSIIRYSIPLMLASLIQMLFNAADLAVLGNMANKSAVSSVGATGAIVGLLVNTFVGMSGGVSVVLANYLGKQNISGVRKVVDTSMFVSFFSGIAIMILSLYLTEPMLRLTGCPSDCFYGAKIYLIIYFTGIPAIMLYNFGSAVLRAGGDSKSPLYYMIFSGIFNVVLNVILCLLMKEKVAAVAIATLVSQIIGAFLVTAKLARSETLLHFNIRKPAIDKNALLKILKHGIPCGFNSALYSISNLQIQHAINDYGEDMIAGNSAASTLEGLVCAFTNAFAMASFAFVGQNLGAKNKKRVDDTVKICVATGISLGLVLGLGLYIFGKPSLSLFIPGEEKAIEYGLVRMKFVLAFYAVAACNQVLSCILQAYGKAMLTTLLNVGAILVFRFIWITFIYPLKKTAENLFVCYTISWSLCMLSLIFAFIIVYSKYKKGKEVKI